MENNLLLTVGTIASYCEVDRKAVREWCRNGALIAHQLDFEHTWNIKVRDFADFLYFNPKYRIAMETQKLKGYRETLRYNILAIVYQRKHKLCTINELADLFNVDPSTVRYWINAKQLNAMRRKQATTKILLKVSDVEKFVNSSKYLKKRYGCYITDNFLNWEFDKLE